MDTIENILQQFNKVREALKQEKQQLENRISEINHALGEDRRERETRPRNELSLRQVIIQAVSKGPLTRDGILEEVQKLGYKFATDNPLNSMGVILYGKNPKFKRENGKFSLAKK